MIEFKLKEFEFDKIYKDGYIEFVPLYFTDKKNNKYPSNIYKLLTDTQMKSLNPVLEEQFTVLLNDNCKLLFKIKTNIETRYYVAVSNTYYFNHDNGLVRVIISNIRNVTKNEYNQIKNYSYFLNQKPKIFINCFDIDIKKLLDINNRLIITLKNKDNTLKYLQNGDISIRSTISNHIYHYKIDYYKISKNKETVHIKLLKSNRLVKKDYLYTKYYIFDTEKSYKFSHEAFSALFVNINDMDKNIKLKITNKYELYVLNKAIKEGKIKYIFNDLGEKRKINTIEVINNKDYTIYNIAFYKEKMKNQPIKEYLKDKKVERVSNYEEQLSNTTVKYFDIPYRKEYEAFQIENHELTLNDSKEKIEKRKQLIIVDELQIIDSSNNHVTRNHKVINQKFYIKIKTSQYDSGYILIEYNGHYCNKCKNYFDFKQSFILQLRNQDVPIHKIESRLIDDNGKRISVDKLRFELYNKESDLHSYGYKVGHSGISKLKRQKILDKLIFDKILSVSEIKDTLNRNISTFKGNKRYEKSVTDWKDDLDYINKKYY